MRTFMKELYEEKFDLDLVSRGSFEDSRSSSDFEMIEQKPEQDYSDVDSLLNASFVSRNEEEKIEFSQKINSIIEKRTERRIKKKEKKMKKLKEKRVKKAEKSRNLKQRMREKLDNLRFKIEAENEKILEGEDIIVPERNCGAETIVGEMDENTAQRDSNSLVSNKKSLKNVEFVQKPSFTQIIGKKTENENKLGALSKKERKRERNRRKRERKKKKREEKKKIREEKKKKREKERKIENKEALRKKKEEREKKKEERKRKREEKKRKSNERKRKWKEERNQHIKKQQTKTQEGKNTPELDLTIYRKKMTGKRKINRRKQQTRNKKVNNSLKILGKGLEIKSSMTEEKIRSILYQRYGDLISEYVIEEYIEGVRQINEAAFHFQTFTWVESPIDKEYWLKKHGLSEKAIEKNSDGYEVGRWYNTNETIFKGKEPFQLNISLPGEGEEEGGKPAFEEDVEVIEYCNDFSVVFLLKSPFVQKMNPLYNISWTVKESLFLVELTLKNQTNNLEVFRNVEKDFKNAIVGKRKLRINKNFFNGGNGTGYEKIGGKRYINHLNPSQREAISSVMSEKFSLIQGPPGTGKTTTIATGVMCLYNYLKKFEGTSGKRILVCADSNQAVNNITEKIIDIFTQFGVNQKRIVRFMSFSAYRRTPFNEKKLRPNLIVNRNLHWDQQKMKRLRESEIVCVTLSMASSIHKRIPKGNFVYSIIDEASQSLEASTLGALKTTTEKLILVGDHKQLGPVVLSRKAREQDYKSIFERLIEGGNQFSKLKTQYRMHPSISKNSNELFYKGELSDGVSKKNRNEWLKCPKIFKNGPKCFMRSTGPESRDNKSYVNYGEINKVIDILKKFRASNIKPEEIGVIAMYSSQVARLRRRIAKWMPGMFSRKIKVATVDSFQGSEMKFIVISTVRSNNGGRVGFLKDKRRLNVAITRAKHGLVLVGNPGTLKKDETWAKILKDYKRGGLIF